VLSLLSKLILLNGSFNSHSISEQTEATLISFLEANDLPAFEETRYRLNQYAPLADLKALFTNRHVGWPYRLLPGLPVTLIHDVLLPGRLFPWGDYYNPYTNTVHLYSDDEAVALHEAGHALDFADFPLKGTYSMLRIVPFLDLYQEWKASERAVEYFVKTADRIGEYHAYRTLWPAYGTYMGSYTPIPFGSVAGAFVGHLAAHVKVTSRRRFYRQMDAVLYPDQMRSPSSTL
jgi:hypothetical protein